MSASTNYLPAKQLGITEEERTAMIATIDVLRLEQVHFDMSTIATSNGGSQPPCGTHACIGGTMSLLMQNGMKLPAKVTHEMREQARTYVQGHEPYIGEGSNFMVDMDRTKLTRLFYDVVDSDVPPAEGIKAIEQFLTGNAASPWCDYEG